MVKNDYYEGTRKIEEFDMLEELSKDNEYDVRIGDNVELIVTIIDFKKGNGKKTWRHTKYVLCKCYAHYKIIEKEGNKIMEKIPYTINQTLQLSQNYAAPQVYAFLVTNKLIKEHEVNLSIKKLSNTNYLIRLLNEEELINIKDSIALHRHYISEHSSTLHSIAYHSTTFDTNIAPNNTPIKNQLSTNNEPTSLGDIKEEFIEDDKNE